MMKRLFLVWLAVCVFLVSRPGSCFADSADRELFVLTGVARAIRALIVDHGYPGSTPSGIPLHSSEMLGRFYETRNYKPAWTGDMRSVSQRDEFVDLIGGVESHGLEPGYYHYRRIRSLVKQAGSGVDTAVELDLLLTDAYLTLGCHFSGGCLRALTNEVQWNIESRDLDIASVLERALGAGRVGEALSGLLPSQEGYKRLRGSLLFYRRIVDKGGWPSVPGMLLMKRGVSAFQVSVLKERLAVSGDYDRDGGMDAFFGVKLEKAVMRFQRRHGMDPDGVVGPLTLKELNVPAEARLRQIELNLERMRWVSRKMKGRYVKVNIADFRLDLVEMGRSVLSMSVIVGRPYWHTPVLSNKIRYLVINPYWKVPDSIAEDELLDKIRSDRGYLSKQGFRIFSGWGGNAREIDPETISWQEIPRDGFVYKLRQEPGPLNPLGRIKFVFPNSFNVYLHDTPGREKFDRSVRSFSHGCIRISRPVELARYLLRDNKSWNGKRIVKAIKSGKRRVVNLSKPVPVHIVYLTSWVVGHGMLQFRDDIYGRDARLYKSLLAKPARLSNASKLIFILH